MSIFLETPPHAPQALVERMPQRATVELTAGATVYGFGARLDE